MICQDLVYQIDMESPWSQIDRQLSLDEWEALKAWRASNPDLRYRFGQVRADGKVFLAYGRKARSGERWGTKEQEEKVRQRTRERNLKQWSSADFRREENKKKRERYATDPDWADSQRKIKSEWAKRNGAKILSKVMKRNACKKQRVHPLADLSRIDSLYEEAEGLTRQGGMKYQVDHIIPLKWGGWHHHDNMQILPESVNTSKGQDPYWRSHEYLDWTDISPSLWPDKVLPMYRKILEIEKITPEVLEDGQPCHHPACYNHKNFPCDYCGRIRSSGGYIPNIDAN